MPSITEVFRQGRTSKSACPATSLFARAFNDIWRDDTQATALVDGAVPFSLPCCSISMKYVAVGGMKVAKFSERTGVERLRDAASPPPPFLSLGRQSQPHTVVDMKGYAVFCNVQNAT